MMKKKKKKKNYDILITLILKNSTDTEFQRPWPYEVQINCWIAKITYQ